MACRLARDGSGAGQRRWGLGPAGTGRRGTRAAWPRCVQSLTKHSYYRDASTPSTSTKAMSPRRTGGKEHHPPLMLCRAKIGVRRSRQRVTGIGRPAVSVDVRHRVSAGAPLAAASHVGDGCPSPWAIPSVDLLVLRARGTADRALLGWRTEFQVATDRAKVHLRLGEIGAASDRRERV